MSLSIDRRFEYRRIRLHCSLVSSDVYLNRQNDLFIFVTYFVEGKSIVDPDIDVSAVIDQYLLSFRLLSSR